MSRSTFFTRTSTSTSKSYKSSLESQEQEVEGELHPLALRDLSPRSSHSYAHSSKRASPSPPPSFYRETLLPSNIDTRTSSKGSSSRGGGNYEDEEREVEPERFGTSVSSSPSRTRERRNGNGSGGGRRIMFAAPPPPIATSVLLVPQYSSARSSSRGSRDDGQRVTQNTRQSVGGGVDPLAVLGRREKAIQRDLQSLLDAQSEGLIQGFGGSLEDGSEAGSNTPTTRSVNGASRRGSGSQGRSGNIGIVPVRQPKNKPIGLRGARRGLLKEMGELAGVKEEENKVLEREIERREILIRKIDTWDSRITAAKSKLSISKNNEAEEEREIHALEDEQGSIDSEIQDLEHRLEILRARKARLDENIKESVNKREARLSSYRGTLREAEAEVASFLRYPPLPPSSVMGEEGFLSLPPARRTLSMAREWWEREQAALTKKKQQTKKEREALEEGSKEWEECMKEVIGFEDELRLKMKSGKEVTETDLRCQVERMGVTIKQLEVVRDKAEGEGWNLLLCAVGAEVEAFKQGRGILMGVLGIVDEDESPREEKEKGKDSDDKRDKEDDDAEGILNGLEGVRLSRHESSGRESSEDDGPNLEELLVDNSGRD